MYQIRTFNKIDPAGLAEFDPALYRVGEDVQEADAVLVRSADLHGFDFPAGLLAVARAGAGVNNIPVDRCTEQGVAVFSTPGANANAVKELVLCAMLVCSRDIPGAVRWVRKQAALGFEVADVVEKGKAAFIGPELYRKSLGVIGLGAIGSLVANMAVDLGMDVYGYDPYLSIDAALRLDRHVHVVQELKELCRKADYLTVHVHDTPQTRGMIDAETIAVMRPGVRFVNLARGAIVDDGAMLAALDTGKVSAYVTDFPNNRLLENPHVIAFPHLGASTPESERNCAVTAALQIRDYLENGNIRDSVNLPTVHMERSGVQRVCVLHRNLPTILAGVTGLLSRGGVNVENMSNKSRGDYAYTMVDLGTEVEPEVLEAVRALPNVVRVRAMRS